MSTIILALDYGDRYIGAAITDTDGRLSLRHSVIDQQQKDVLPELVRLITAEQVGQVLVGVPVSLSGEATAQTEASNTFMSELAKALPGDIKVTGVDETFTSKEAERIIRQEGGKPEDAHAEAARLMLESYLKGRATLKR